MKYCDWNGRPAVYGVLRAKAITEPGRVFTEVDFEAVSTRGVAMGEAEWRARFEPAFGPLHPLHPDLDPDGLTKAIRALVMGRTLQQSAKGCGDTEMYVRGATMEEGAIAMLRHMTREAETREREGN
jgi:hypothetical protein